MNSGFHFRLAVASAIIGSLLCGLGQCVWAQEAPYTLHVSQDEVITDLIAVDHNTYLPDQTLTAADLIVTDNKKAVRLTSFVSSSVDSVQPLAVWVIAQCDLKYWSVSGSRFLQGRSNTLADGLHHLSGNDTVAAAGWCDDGRHQVGTPGHDSAIVTSDLEHWLLPIKAPFNTTKRKGELSLQAMLLDITAAVSAMNPRPRPVLIFMHQDDTGTQTAEYTHLIKILLEHSSIAFLVTDGKGTFHPSADYLANGNIAFILSALSADTGGSAFILSSFEDHPNVLSEVCASIIDRLHGRYQLSFVPQNKDGKVHALDIRLTDEARQKHGGLLLQARKVFLAPLPK